MYVDRIADGKYWNVDGNQRAAYGYTGWSIQTAKDNLMDQVYEFSRVLLKLSRYIFKKKNIFFVKLIVHCRCNEFKSGRKI